LGNLNPSRCFDAGFLNPSATQLAKSPKDGFGDLRMAMAEKKSLFVHGENGGQVVTTGNPITDLERAQDVARRYRCEFVDLTDFQLHHELFKKFSPELMFRYNFVPLEETADGKLAIAIADPSQLMMIDEISLLLQKRIVTKVATLKQISTSSRRRSSRSAFWKKPAKASRSSAKTRTPAPKKR
jgi:hypothetical protein